MTVCETFYKIFSHRGYVNAYLMSKIYMIRLIYQYLVIEYHD